MFFSHKAEPSSATRTGNTFWTDTSEHTGRTFKGSVSELNRWKNLTEY